MKKILLVATLALSASSAFAIERYLGTVRISNNDRGDTVQVNSCDGYRSRGVDFLTLIVRADALNLRQIIIRKTDSYGRPSGMTVAKVQPGVYQPGERIFVSFPGPTCIDDIRIVADSVGGREGGRRPHDRRDRNRNERGHSKPTTVDVYGEISSGHRW